MIDNKLSLTFVLPGSIKVSSQECEKNSKENCISRKSKRKKDVVKGIYEQPRKTKNAAQHINVNTEAYLYMLNTPTNTKLAKIVKTAKGTVRAWDLLSEHEKLKHHLDLIAHDLHAISYEYEVLGD